jgi:predicted AlkP superfamily phosphohydrolase/phosphomutase
MRRARGSFTMLQTLDWAHTQAYPGLPSENGIFLNVQGREPAGLVRSDDYEPLRSEIIVALQAWTDPRRSQPVMAAVHRREEVYHGPYVDRAPDIVFEPRPGYKVTHLPGEGALLSDVSAALHGFHEREGIFMAVGPGIRAGALAEAPSIEDVAPTVLYLLGLSVPEDMDGRVLTELFPLELLAARPVQRGAAGKAGPETPSRSPYSEAEARQIEHRLRDLGYLE